MATTTATEIIVATQPAQIQTETIYIQYNSNSPQQQDVTETIYQSYAFTIAKRYAEPAATPVADAEVRRRRCKVLL